MSENESITRLHTYGNFIPEMILFITWLIIYVISDCETASWNGNFFGIRYEQDLRPYQVETLVLLQSSKLSNIQSSQYLDVWPLENTRRWKHGYAGGGMHNGILVDLRTDFQFSSASLYSLTRKGKVWINLFSPSYVINEKDLYK